jgi:hypothetical protein
MVQRGTAEALTIGMAVPTGAIATVGDTRNAEVRKLAYAPGDAVVSPSI